MIDLSVNIAGMRFANPVFLASGMLSSNKTGLQKAGTTEFGAIVTKSSTINPSPGNPRPHLVIRQGYVINADGIHNQGYKIMASIIKDVKNNGKIKPVIASVAGASEEEFVKMSLEFVNHGANGIELNFVCPNRGKLVGQSQEETIGRYWVKAAGRCPSIIHAVKNAVNVPVWVKFPFETIYEDHRIIREMEESGADALVITASIPRAMALDLETGKPLLGNPRGAGAVGGFIMKPLGVNCVTELSRIVKIPVIASGGVFSGLDIIEYLMAGAHAVAVLTAFIQKITVKDMLDEMTGFMLQHGYSSLQDFRGISHKYLPSIS